MNPDKKKKTIHKHLLSEFDQPSKFVLDLPGCIYWKDKNGIYLGCNQSFLDMIGLDSVDQVIGKKDEDFCWAQQAEALRKHDKEVMMHGKTSFEETVTLPDNMQFTYTVVKAPLHDDSGNVIGIVGISLDITQQKKYEKELKEAKEKAEAASQAKSDFIASMSHDLRTPITGILGVAQDSLNTAQESDATLKKDTPLNLEESLNLNQRLIHHIKNNNVTIINAIGPLLNFFNEILETMRLGKGIASQIPESFDAYELIEHNVSLLQPTAKHKKVDLITNIDKKVPKYIHGLRTYIDCTLTNLISNALKFTDKGHVKISMHVLEDVPTTYKKGDKISLQISIEDTGIGISEDKYDAIFERFSRLNASHEGIYKGSGLGLYTVKIYIKAMRGQIKVKSEVGKGTCFIITLPFIVSDKVDRPRDTSFAIPVDSLLYDKKTHVAFSISSPASDNSTASCNILIVEDNAAAAKALLIAIKSFNCNVDIAENGTEAIEKAENNTYDMILMDVGLPDMTGIDVTKAIRLFSDTKKAQVPIVAITGHADTPEIRQECLDAGMQDVLSKPARPLLLQAAFQEFVFGNIDKETSSLKESTLLAEDTTDLPLFDLEASERMFGGEFGAVRELLTLLKKDLKVSSDIFEKTFKEKDIATIRPELHRAIGGVVYICAPLLEKALKTFQTAIKKEPPDWEECERLYHVMQETIDAFRKECDKWI